MNKYLLSICCILSGLLLFGCPPPKKDIKSEQGECTISKINVDVNDKLMNISWVNDCQRNISGYNIYISQQSNSNVPFNNTTFDGDTNPADGIENFKAEFLENGKKYYVSVCVVYPDQTLSKRSKEIVAVCGPRGEIELSFRYKSENDGFSFDQNNFVRADNDKNDLYYFAKDGIDYINSPTNLGGFLRESEFITLDYKGDFKELRENIDRYRKISTEKKLAVSQGDWILMQTDKNTHALIKILGFSGKGEERKIKLFYAYSPIWGDLIF